MSRTGPLDPEAERRRALESPPPKRQLSAKIALASCVVVVVVGCFGFWWVALRQSAPPPVSAPVVVDGDIPADAIVPSSADGTWAVHQGDKTFAGYRIKEVFAGEVFTKTAVGRTPAVTGTLVVSGSEIVDAEIVADLTELTSDSANRDATQQEDGLEIVRYRTATFRLTEAVVLPRAPVQGEEITATAVGELTLHGVTKPIELELEGTWNGATISVSGRAPIVLADYEISPPQNDFVGVEDQGEFEVSLVLLWDGPPTPPTPDPDPLTS